VEHDDGAQVVVERTEGPFDRVSISDARRKVAIVGVMDIDEFDLDRPAADPAEHVHAGMDEQPTEPGLEPIRIAKGRQVPPRANERFLDGILGPLGVAGDQPRDDIEPGGDGACQALERAMIPSLRLLHESSVHAVPRPPRPAAVFTLPWRTK
jgi:hypothetical protein